MAHTPIRTGMKVHWLASSALVALAGFFAAPAVAQSTTAPAEAAASDDIIVTASRRDGKLRELAASVSAVSGKQLEELGAQSNADYLGRLPGVVFNEGVSGQSTVVIRGVGTTAGLDQGQGPTGYFVNDVPLTEPGYAAGIPDIDTFDLNRVEVLRGPQGTLFGSSSLGGAVNYITNLADASGFDAAAQGTISSIDRTQGELSYAVKGMINIPLVTDRLAVRVLAFRRRDAGYIDNLGTGVNGASDLDVEGVRGSIVATLDPLTKLTFIGIYQKNYIADSQTAFSLFGPYARSTINRAPADYRMMISSLRLDHTFDFANLVVIGSISDKTHDLTSDVSRTAVVRTFVPNGAISREYQFTNMKTLEARLSSPGTGNFNWLIGGIYSSTYGEVDNPSYAPGGAAALAARYPAAQLDGDIYNRGRSFRSGSELAAFGEVSLKFLDTFTATVGGRLFDTRYSIYIRRVGISYPLTGQFIPLNESKENGFVPKYSLAWRPSQDLTVYATAAKGFRFGNPNTLTPVAGFDTPTEWKSDSVWNYEIGTHARIAGGLLDIDASIFNIDWSNIQVRLVRPIDSMTYGSNAGSARIRGAEFSGTLRPVTGLTLTANVTYLDAKLTETVLTASPPLLAGTQLPGASEWQISDSISYRFPGDMRPTITLSHRYLSDAPETLQQPTIRVGGYHQFDARVAVDIGDFNLAAFASNIGNTRAVSFGYGTGTGIGQNEFIIRPRQIGLTVNWKMPR